MTITGDGSQTRDFVYVKDTAKIFRQVALDNRIKNDVFNVCTGKGISIQDLANIISPEQTYIPLTYGEVEHICGDNKKLASLGIKPQTSLEEGIEALEIVYEVLRENCFFGPFIGEFGWGGFCIGQLG